MKLSRISNQAASNRSIVMNADNSNDLVLLYSLEIIGLKRDTVDVQRIHYLTNLFRNVAIYQHFPFF